MVASAQVAPLLLQAFFHTLRQDGTFEQAAQLVPVLLERVASLYAIPSFQVAVRDVLAREILEVFRRHPRLIVELSRELLDFISNRRNVGEGREEFFVHVVWIVGAHASGPICPTDVVVQ